MRRLPQIVLALATTIAASSFAMTGEEFNSVTTQFKTRLDPIYVANGAVLEPIRLQMDADSYHPVRKNGLFAPRTDLLAEMTACNSKVIVLQTNPFSFPSLEEDVLLFMLCHEAGHNVGGSPLKTSTCDDGKGPKQFTSAEGQADYWAASTCLKMFRDRISGPRLREVQARFESACTTLKPNASASELEACVQVTWLEYKFLKYLTDISPGPLNHIDSIDAFYSFLEQPVSELSPKGIFLDHPADECRTKTYMAATLGLERPNCWYNP